MTELIFENIKLRPLQKMDKETLAKLCNNKKIWDNLRDFLPHPYTVEHAESFIEFCQNQKPQTTFAIEYKRQFVGCIGLVIQTDIYRMKAEIGYWLGEPYWGLGIAAKAVGLIVDYGFNQLNLARIETGVFDFNKASQRVLEKAGFRLECIFEKSVYKNSRLLDEYRYAIINKNFQN